MPDVRSLQALVVDIIRILWEHGFFNTVEWLVKIHDNWFEHWVNWKTAKTMADVDRQIKELRQPSGVDDPIYTETETELRLRAPWHEDDNETGL
jgi:hypothetical protein